MNDGLSLPKQIDTYTLYESFAKGGMAAAHYGLHLRPGFSRPVAIKRLHPHLASEPGFVELFLEEARLAARVRHPNVVPMLDVVSSDGEVLLVMDYVAGESLSTLLRIAHQRDKRVPLPIVVSIMVGLLEGLHAAHEAVDELGHPLGLVHRDVSPQNVLVGLDGVSRVLDFGIAKAAGSTDATREGQVRGKIAYMAPEQLDESGRMSFATDLYSAGVVLWETLALRRMFSTDSPPVIAAKVSRGVLEPLSKYVPDLPPEVDAVVRRALATRPEDRYASAREMRIALEEAAQPAAGTAVGDWVDELAGETLRTRSVRLVEIERDHASRGNIALPPPAAAPPIQETTVITDTLHMTGPRMPHPSVPPGYVPFPPTSVAPPQKSSQSAFLVALVAFGIALFLLFVVVYRRVQAPPRLAESPPVVDAPSAWVPAPAVPAPESSEVSPPNVEGAPTSLASAQPSSGHPPMRRPARRPDCTTPWKLGPDNVKTYRRECYN